MKLDLSNRSLRKIEPNLTSDNGSNDEVDAIILDDNSINKLENLDQFTRLKQVFIGEITWNTIWAADFEVFLFSLSSFRCPTIILWK
jgi:hypothetical protein